MSIGSISGGALPSIAGTLPDLFRRPDDAAPSRGDEAPLASRNGGDGPRDERATGAARTPDDTTRMLARHAALGPLTYGRRPDAVAAQSSAPISHRGALLDVRG